MNRLRRGALVGISLLLAAGLSGTGYASGVHSATKSLKVVTNGSKFAFKAKTITIAAGTKVTWTNTTDAAHTITSTGHPPSKFNKQLATGAKVSITFTKKGTYHYFCAIHPYMVGTIVVK